MTRRAKIVCTLGPASSSAASIGALVDHGMDVARLNFSHGTHAEHAAACARVRAAAEGRPLAVLADLQGPKIRLGAFAGGEATLESGAEFTLTTEAVEGDPHHASVTYQALPRDVRKRDVILLDDGRLRLEVRAVRNQEVRTRVLEGGRISDHKGINLPGVRLSAPALTEKDRDDLTFALSLPVDWVALSFVRAPEDAAAARAVMAEAGRETPLLAKIEKPEAVADLESIVRAFDGLMVARGDLGVELPLERVPGVQKRAVSLAREHAKPVIVATEMLESMIRQARPTRAEASDVANAVRDGADALMLSGETSIGRHPVEAVAMMDRIIAAAEDDGLGSPAPLAHLPATAEEAIARAAARAAEELGAKAVAAFTQSGATARLVARHRPGVPLLAFTPTRAVRDRLALVWGVESFVVPEVGDTDQMVAQVERSMLERGHGRRGDRVVIVAGMPPGRVGATNTLRVHRLGGD